VDALTRSVSQPSGFLYLNESRNLVRIFALVAECGLPLDFCNKTAVVQFYEHKLVAESLNLVCGVESYFANPGHDASEIDVVLAGV